MSNVTRLPVSPKDSKGFCEMLAEMGDEIENIAVVIHMNKDSRAPGQTLVFSTPMTNERVTWLRYIFNESFTPVHGDDV